MPNVDIEITPIEMISTEDHIHSVTDGLSRLNTTIVIPPMLVDEETMQDHVRREYESIRFHKVHSCLTEDEQACIKRRKKNTEAQRKYRKRVREEQHRSIELSRKTETVVFDLSVKIARLEEKIDIFAERLASVEKCTIWSVEEISREFT
jgi:23S rRNA maturation mini-RNase III